MAAAHFQFDKVYSQMWEFSETSRDLIDLKEVTNRDSIKCSGNCIRDSKINRKLESVNTQINHVFDTYMKQLEEVAVSYIEEKKARKRLSALNQLEGTLAAASKAAGRKLRKKNPRNIEEARMKIAAAYGRKVDTIEDEDEDEKAPSRLLTPSSDGTIRSKKRFSVSKSLSPLVFTAERGPVTPVPFNPRQEPPHPQHAGLKNFVRRMKSQSLAPDPPEDQAKKSGRASKRASMHFGGSGGSVDHKRTQSDIRATITSAGVLMALR